MDQLLARTHDGCNHSSPIRNEQNSKYEIIQGISEKL